MSPARPGARRVAGALLALLLLPALTGSVRADERVTPGEILVLRRAPGGLGAASAPLELAERARELGLRVREARSLAPAASGFADRAWLVRLEAGEDPAAAAARLAADPGIAWAGPNRWIVLEQPDPPDTPPVPVLTTPPYRPNDPLFERQAGFVQAGFLEVGNTAIGRGIVVAILDTGVQLDHPDLVGQFAVNEAEANGVAGVDDDGNGYVDDVTGYDFTDVPGLPGFGDAFDRDPDPSDDVGHGTNVAGVVAAVRDNALGIAGAAPGARILPVRCGFRVDSPFLGGGLQEDDIAAGIVYAADNGADILNLSFGDVVDAPVIREAIRYARGRGCLVVASAGNDGDDAAHYPAGYPGVVSAGASSGEARALFSVFGDDLDLLAPGVAVWTTALDGDYAAVNGTSFSAPFFAAAAALVWAEYPTWTAEEVAWAVRFGCRRDAAGWTPAWGWGHLDAAAALGGARLQGRPPSTLLEDIARDGQEFRVRGSVVGPSLTGWSLEVEREGAVAPVNAGDAPRLDEPLGTWTAAGGPGGEAVFVLRARYAGWPPVETRHRQEAGDGNVLALSFAVEPQIRDDGWDVVAWFRTDPTPLHASGTLSRGGRVLSATEAAAGTNHALRFPGPLERGPWTLETGGRVSRDPAVVSLRTDEVTVPPAPAPREAIDLGVRIPGEPMRGTVDLDGDGYPEFVLEAPPAGGTYGNVVVVEIDPAAPDPVREVWTAPYTGIPIAGGDGDGDGRQELIVFRLGGWNVYEQPPGGGFPTANVFAGEAGSLPVGFVTGPAGRLLVSTFESQLRLSRPGPGGYDAWVAVTGDGVGFGPGGVFFDPGGDGRVHVALVDLEGRLAGFELTGAGATFLGSFSGPGGTERLTGALAVLADPGGDRLVSLEVDPGIPSVEGDFLRSATRVRGWTRSGPGLEAASEAVAFSGAETRGPLRLLASGTTLVRADARRVDLLRDDAPVWDGRVVVPDSARGAALLDTGSRRLLWSGSADEGRGTLFELPAGATLPSGSSLRVTAVAPAGPDSLAVTLERELDGCGAGSWFRRGTVGVELGSGPIQTDTLPRGWEGIYRWAPIGCAPSDLPVRAVDPPRATAVHEGGERVRLTFDRPVRTEAGDVALIVNGTPVVPAAWGVDREATGLWVSAPGGVGAPEAVRLRGIIDAVSSLPVEGVSEALVPLGAPPVPVDPPRLLAVRPGGTAGAPALEVEVAGNAPCLDGAWRFVVDPGDLPLTGTEMAGTVILSLAEPLAAGGYRLSLDPACADPTAPGAARDFAVGLLLFPNPVVGGVDLTVANVPADAVIEMVTPDGQRVREIAAGTGGDRVSVATADLAPGLYLVRVRTPDGAGDWQRIAVLR